MTVERKGGREMFRSKSRLLGGRPGYRLSGSLLALSCLIMAAVPHAVEAAAPPRSDPADQTPLELFEDKVPTEFMAQKGKLAISKDHAKDGVSSLKWTWQQGDGLTIRHPFPFRPFEVNGSDQRRDGIAFWIYSPQPHEGQYRFQFFKGDKPASSFAMNAQFSGWRAAVVSFEQDMEGQPLIGMNRLVITPPTGAAAGTTWIDQFGLDMRIDLRHPAADYQLPYLNKGALQAANRHWTALLHFDGWLKLAGNAGGVVPVAASTQVEQMSALIDADLLEGKSAAPEMATRDLFRADGSIKSLSETAHQWDMYEGSGVSGESIEVLRATTSTWTEFGKGLRAVAVAYRRSNADGEREKLRALFIRLTSHLTEQGLARGSGQGLMHHQGYIIGDWAEAMFLMRDALGEQRSDVQNAIGYYSGLGRIYEPVDQIAEFNVDVMNTLLEPMLFAVLMESDKVRRGLLLTDFSNWMSISTLKSSGLGGGIKPDGSVFHHGQHYPAYGNGGLTGVTATLRYLSGSRYAVSDEAYALVRDAVLKTRLFSNGGLIPMSLTGRHPDGMQSITVAPFRSLAQAKGAADPEIASAYLRLAEVKWAGADRGAPTAADRKLARALAAQGVKPEADPDGSWTMNHSSMALHRRDGWLLTARGHSRYLVGNESYNKKNLYGRTINYGALEFMPADAAKRGFAKEGWNWNRWPGTTSVQQPLDRLKANVLNVETAAGVEEMLLSEEIYSGGLDFRGRQAMFAMKLQGHPKYRDDLRARKSVFMFDNRVIALGTGITSSDTQSHVQTTLFQDRLLPGGEIASLDGFASPWSANENSLWLDSGRFVRDERGNGFCLAPGQRVAFQRGTQVSIDETGTTPTRGEYSSMAIDHGIAPSGSTYEYALLAGMGNDAGRKLCGGLAKAKTAAYTVIARSDRAHIVRDRATGLTAYALFEEGMVENGGLLRSVSSPSMLMLRSEAKMLSGAFVNPDLNLYQGRDPEQYDVSGARRERSVYGLPWMEKPSQPVETVVTLKGRWKLAQPAEGVSVRQAGKTTELLFRTSHATPVQFELMKD